MVRVQQSEAGKATIRTPLFWVDGFARRCDPGAAKRFAVAIARGTAMPTVGFAYQVSSRETASYGRRDRPDDAKKMAPASVKIEIPPAIMALWPQPSLSSWIFL